MRRPVRWKRVGLWSGGTLLALVVTWLVAGYLVFVDPKVSHPTHADAVVVLGSPVNNGRLDAALKLVHDGVSTNLVISLNSPKQWQARNVCQQPPAGVAVTCFNPSPSTTRGEAEEVHRLVARHGWRNIVVVTSTYHVSRARMIFRRCFDGTLQMVAARRGISLRDWAYQYFYQSAAYVKAALQSGC